MISNFLANRPFNFIINQLTLENIYKQLYFAKYTYSINLTLGKCMESKIKQKNVKTILRIL